MTLTNISADEENKIRAELKKHNLREEQIDDAIRKVRIGEPCAPCGESKLSNPTGPTGPPGPPGTPGLPGIACIENKPPYYVLLAEALHKTECQYIIGQARELGWQQGTIVDGKATRNSSVRFLHDKWLLDRIRNIAEHVAPILNIEADPSKLKSVQIGRYLPPGEDYGWHVDHDVTRRHLSDDRKLSIVGALTDGGCLHIDKVGPLWINEGDLLVFSGITSHMAPPLKHKRYTLVAWVPGPPWK